jgi:hypothetical protein
MRKFVTFSINLHVTSVSRTDSHVTVVYVSPTYRTHMTTYDMRSVYVLQFTDAYTDSLLREF